MKKAKFILPILAFVIAIGGAFATEYFTPRVPNSYQVSLGVYLDCVAPFDGYVDSSGDIYDSGADEPNEYYCDDTNSESGKRCICLIDDGTTEVGPATYNNLSYCIPLWKVFPEGDDD